MTVPSGHSHPSTIQMRGQATTPVELHARWQLGCLAHSFLICPLIGHAVMIIFYETCTNTSVNTYIHILNVHAQAHTYVHTYIHFFYRYC